MSHDVIYFPSEKCFPDGGLVCPMDPSEPSQRRFVHRSQTASIGHICSTAAKFSTRNCLSEIGMIAHEKIHRIPSLREKISLSPASRNQLITFGSSC